MKNKTVKPKLIVSTRKKLASRENGKKGGRPSRVKERIEALEPVDIELMLKLVAAGMTDFEVAREMGIHVSTLSVWMSTEPRLGEAFRAAKEKAEERLRRALYMKAVGFSYYEITEEPCVIMDKEHGKMIYKKELAITKRVKKYIPPDPVCGTLWMRLHDPKGFPEKYGLTAAEGKPLVDNRPTFINAVTNNAVKPEEITDEHRKRVAHNLAIIRKYGGLDTAVPGQV